MAIPETITRSHVLEALRLLDDGKQHRFSRARRYRLVHGGKEYSPKAVVGVAAELAEGRSYGPDDFSGGEDPGHANHFLRRLGFEIIDSQRAPSNRQVGVHGSRLSTVGTTYRSAAREPRDDREPFAYQVDPERVERGNRGHQETQDLLADALRARGIEPCSPTADHPEYDLAFEHGGAWWVVEVKSTTPENEEKQLRLGLGQVLRYQHQLRERSGQNVRAVLVPERHPADASWAQLCTAVGVQLVAGPTFDRLWPVLEDVGRRR